MSNLVGLTWNLSRLLFEHDPMQTCCRENDAFDEYEYVASTLAVSMLDGELPKTALRSALTTWFGDELAAEQGFSPLVTEIQAHHVSVLEEYLQKLQHTLRQKAAGQDTGTLLGLMGYTSRQSHHRFRLLRVLEDPYLGLESAEYDLVHERRGFLFALCRVLNVAESDASEAIEKYDTLEKIRCDAYRPWLFVETENSDERLGSFINASVAGKRKLRLPADSWRQPLDTLLEYARDLIFEHIAQTSKTLRVWGRVTGYRLHFADDEVIHLTLQGKVI
ncbi:hypothetical protein LL947_06525 [Halomonas sp. BLK-85]